MAKTSQPATPEEYIAQLSEPRRTEIRTLHDAFSRALPKLAPSLQYGMIGYGSYHYKYESGREGDAPVVALSSRAGYISVYGCGEEIRKEIQEDLPKADFGKGCIRFKKLADVDLKSLVRIVKSAAQARQKSLAAAK